MAPEPTSVAGSELSRIGGQQFCDQQAPRRSRRNANMFPRRPLASLPLVLLLLLAAGQLLASAHSAGRPRATRQVSGESPEVAPSTEASSGVASTPVAETTQPEQASSSAAAAATTTTTTSPARAAAPSKYPPVNFTLVEQLFAETLAEPEVAARWRRMDKTLTEGVRAALKVVFPHIVSMASDAKVSGACSGAILKWILNLRNMREWAVQMLDAVGKPSAGLLEGSLTLFGNYRQCLRVRAPDEDEIEINDERFVEYFRGQYCVLELRPPLPERARYYSLNSTIEWLLSKSYKYYEKNVYDSLAELAMAFNFVSIRADLCVPSLCSRDDIQRVADFLANKVEMRARVQRCDSQLDERRLDRGQLLSLLALGGLLGLVLASSLATWLLSLRQEGAKSLGGSSGGGGSLAAGKAARRSPLALMSLQRSLSRIRNVHLDRIDDSKPVALYSLRLLLVLWIFLVALASQLNLQYLRELLELRSLIMHWPMQLLVNSSLAYDALILLTAFTYAYQNINSNQTDLIKYNLAKWARLAPSIMLMVALTVLTPLFYADRSPVWRDFVDQPAQVCQSTGWINALFLQNLLPSEQVCLPQTWIFCVELQLCLMAIPLVHALNKAFDSRQGRFKLTSAPVLVLLLAICASAALNFLNTLQNSLPPAWFLTFPDKRDQAHYLTVHLYRTWVHLGPFASGLLAGHLCRCMALGSRQGFSGRPYGRRCCDNLMLLCSLLLSAALVFGTHAWSLSGRAHLDEPVASALYAALAPLAWSLAWCLLLFQIVVPRQETSKLQAPSFARRLLAGDANLVRLGRLSFLAYLINPYVNTLVLAVQEQAVFSSLVMLGHTFIGNLVLTFALAFAASALVELPCRRLIKKLLIGSRRHSTNFDLIARQLNVITSSQPPSRAPEQPMHGLHLAPASKAASGHL